MTPSAARRLLQAAIHCALDANLTLSEIDGEVAAAIDDWALAQPAITLTHSKEAS